jgi:ribosome-binding factor A
MGGKQRPDQVASLIQSEMADLLLRGLKDPRIGFVSVMGVEVSVDLRHARVLVSVLGEPAAREATMAGLHSATPYLRRALGERLGLRYVPELRIVADDSLERGARIASLLRQIEEEKQAEGSVEP